MRTIFIFSILMTFFIASFMWIRDSNAQDYDYRVKVVYFYPADYIPDPKYLTIINSYVSDVQKWYGSKVSKTFLFEPAQIVKGQKTAAEYGGDDSADVWRRVSGELGVWDGLCEKKTIWLIFTARTISFNGGWSCAPAYAGSIHPGVAMNPEESFDADVIGQATGTCPNGYPYADYNCSPDASRAVTAHELGHAFTLPHPKDCGTELHKEYCEQTVMWAWWKGLKNLGLLNITEAPEGDTLRTFAWFWFSSPDTSSPTVSITYPTNGTILKRNAPTTITASASDNIGVSSVEFLVNGAVLCTDTASPYSCSWKVPSEPNTNYAITARAYDAAGNSASSSVAVKSSRYLQ